MSALLADAPALQAAVAAARADGGGALAVTEYVDARNADGHHEKLSYFRIGAQLFPSALDVSRNWVCKGVIGDPDGIDDHAREQAFLSGNPHADLLGPAFEAAGIGYGRADYAMIGGRPQVFEINTNPLIDRPEAMPPALQPYAQLLVGRWLAALEAFRRQARGRPGSGCPGRGQRRHPGAAIGCAGLSADCSVQSASCTRRPG